MLWIILSIGCLFAVSAALKMRAGLHNGLGRVRTSPSQLFLFEKIGEKLNDKILMENAERLGRIEQSLIGKKHELKTMAPIKLPKAMSTRLKDSSLLVNAVLLRDGCVSISDVISSQTASELLTYINKEKQHTEDQIETQEADYDDRFGAVNNRRNRADMFLPYAEPIVQKALKEAATNLSPLLLEMDNMKDTGNLHELSCIISDPGSPTQCIHCDTPWLPNVAPLYTFFIALQDVEDDMGHTLYLPKTHVKQAHDIFNAGIKQKENLIAASPPVKTKLTKGDVVIFDSRVLHCGGPNTSEQRPFPGNEEGTQGTRGARRVLFYFTFTSGDTATFNPNPSRGTGSIRTVDRYEHTLHSILTNGIK